MEKVINYIKKVTDNERNIIVSCSGGPDSMCLLKLLLDNTDNVNIICAHVNHCVREESVEEEEFVKNFCKKNNIIFELLKIEEYNGNFHNDARVQRYTFLKMLADKYNASKIFTAHHGDDLIESILMRITRGSNLNGYKGFEKSKKVNKYNFIKPLVYVDKKTILEYNKNNGIEYRIDKTNDSLEYTRNKFRHLILPNLKQIDDNIHLKFLKFSEKISEYDDFVRNYISLKEVVKDDYIDLKLYETEDEFIKKRCIEIYINKIQAIHEFYVTDKIIFEIEKLINSEKGKVTIDLPNSFIGKKEKKRFYIEKI